MAELSVNAISKKYEFLYKKISERANKEIAFNAVNNAMIYAYFLCDADSSFVGESSKDIQKQMEYKYGKDLFFIDINDEKYEIFFNEAIEQFVTMFKNSSANGSLETVLGNVLEKHINQRETGAYYTPSDTTKYMSWNAILISLINKCGATVKKRIFDILKIDSTIKLINNGNTVEDNISFLATLLSQNEKQEMISGLYAMSIIDPTCGSGAFIISAFECLEYIINSFSFDINYEKLIDTLYGLDIEPEAIKLTKLRLLMKTFGKLKSYSFFKEKYHNHFRNADALKGSDYVIDEEGFDWKKFGVKFDCIIGNPPYVEKSGYVSDKFYTNKCGNLYANTIERACNIANDKSVIALIVPLSFVATPRMKSSKEYLERNSESVYYATFADRPGCIFSGVHQRLTIFFAQIGENKNCEVYSSGYHYWYNEERENLFKNIRFIRNSYKGILPKVGNDIENSLYEKMSQGNTSFLSILNASGDYPIYVSTRIGFWAKAFFTNVFTSKEFKEYHTSSKKLQCLAVALFNSSVFYFMWVLTSDCWHITNANMESLKFNKENLAKIDFDKLVYLVDRLMDELEKNKKYIGSKQTDYEYKHKYSKQTIDMIDECIAPLFSLTKTEVDYIKHFTERYRINTMKTEKQMNVIDLFSGVGGFSSGFRKAGYNILLANEIDASIAESYSKNHPETIMLNDDIKNILPIVKEYKGKVDVIIGGPPCQGFSMAGARIRTNKSNAFLDDPRNYLFRHYFAIVQEIEPNFFVMENVPGMLSMAEGKIIEEIESLFTNSDNFKNGPYKIHKQILSASDYGVPQDRHRLIIFGTKKDIDIPKLFKDVFDEMKQTGEIENATIYDAISDLNWLESGEGSFEQEYRDEPLTKYQRERRANSKSLKNHIATSHNQVAIRRIQELKPGGRRLDLTEGENIKSVHSGAYGRMRWDELSKTIITRFDTPSSGVYIHPERTRTITPREAARIQSFDDDFVFYGNKSSVIKQIGNAVPPLLAYYLAKVIEKASEK